jgi:uridylate kinase
VKLVFSVGGSLVCPDGIDLSFIAQFSSLVDELSGMHEITVVVGGGKLARTYIRAAEDFQASDEVKDYLGIEATHLNAMLVASALGRQAVYRRTVSKKDFRKGVILVTGGTTPGHSTDAVAAELAVLMKADLLINASNITGVYEKDPSVSPAAKMLEKITPVELLKIVARLPQTPGKYALIDKLAVQTIKKAKIKTIILNGRDIENIKKAVEGKKFTGTIVG